MGHGGHWRQSLLSARRQALGKDFFLNILCRGPLARPLAKTPFAEGQARPSAKIFFLVFWTQFFCGAIIHYLKLNFKIWAKFDFFIYFPNLFLFVYFFEYFKFELQVDGIMQFSDLKNVIHGIWCMLSPYPRTRIKFRAIGLSRAFAEGVGRRRLCELLAA